MPMIGIRVDDETKRKWDILNKLDHTATKELKKALAEILEEYSWWFEEYERMQARRGEKREENALMEEIANISEQEILSEI